MGGRRWLRLGGVVYLPSHLPMSDRDARPELRETRRLRKAQQQPNIVSFPPSQPALHTHHKSQSFAPHPPQASCHSSLSRGIMSWLPVLPRRPMRWHLANRNRNPWLQGRVGEGSGRSCPPPLPPDVHPGRQAKPPLDCAISVAWSRLSPWDLAARLSWTPSSDHTGSPRTPSSPGTGMPPGAATPGCLGSMYLPGPCRPCPAGVGIESLCGPWGLWSRRLSMSLLGGRPGVSCPCPRDITGPLCRPAPGSVALRRG